MKNKQKNLKFCNARFYVNCLKKKYIYIVYTYRTERKSNYIRQMSVGYTVFFCEYNILECCRVGDKTRKIITFWKLSNVLAQQYILYKYIPNS